jgi:hypothetical protein
MHDGGLAFRRGRHTRVARPWNHRIVATGSVAMGSSGNLPWWSTIVPGAADAGADTDYADMGTAFGLDASLAGEPAAEDGERPDD